MNQRRCKTFQVQVTLLAVHLVQFILSFRLFMHVPKTKWVRMKEEWKMK